MSLSRRLRHKNKAEHRLAVDPSRLKMGNTYSVAPEYYYDIEFDCRDCGSTEVWSASRQKWWYEEAQGYFFSGAVRCRRCRATEKARIRQARIDAGHDPDD